MSWGYWQHRHTNCNLGCPVGALWAGLHTVSAEEAAQGWVEITRPQVPQTGSGGVIFTGKTKATAHATLTSPAAKGRKRGRARQRTAAVSQATH